MVEAARRRRTRETTATVALLVLPVGLAVLVGLLALPHADPGCGAACADPGAVGRLSAAIGAAGLAAAAVVVAAARLAHARSAFWVPLAAVCTQFVVWNVLPLVVGSIRS